MNKKNQRSRIFIDKEMTTKVIMDCRTRAVHKSITRLMLKQFDVILTKEQSVLTKIKSSFKGKKHANTI